MLHAQCTSALSSGFPISHDNAEAPDRWGGKTKHHLSLSSYFLSNTSAKNYRNWIVYVKNTWYSKSKVRLWDTVYKSLIYLYMYAIYLHNVRSGGDFIIYCACRMNWKGWWRCNIGWFMQVYFDTSKCLRILRILGLKYTHAVNHKNVTFYFSQ